MRDALKQTDRASLRGITCLRVRQNIVENIRLFSCELGSQGNSMCTNKRQSSQQNPHHIVHNDNDMVTISNNVNDINMVTINNNINDTDNGFLK